MDLWLTGDSKYNILNDYVDAAQLLSGVISTLGIS
jgi:hypothetical protein